MMRRTMVFMALQDAAALDKRIKYTEEMANCDYDGMLVVFESDFASKRAEQNQLAAALTTLGLIKPGQRPEDVSVETVKQFSNMTLVQVLESVSGMMESQRKQMRTPTPANASNPAASKPAAAKPATPTPTASKPATPKPAASTPTVAKPTGAKAATPKPSAKPTPAPKPPTTTGNVRQKECSPDCLCENELMTRSVQCFHDNPFTLPDPLSRNLASFIHYLENTCEGMLSKQSQFMLGADWRQSVLTPIQQAQLCFSCVMGAGGMRGFEWDIGIEDEDFGSRMTRVCKGLGIDTPEKMRALKLM
ncbi:hypothetical protein DFS34DRAFT_599667 [Phlyctochytrium arcticum]|nr:hypothetical protein DFS34DRAFT_599667 [Phlyctochytrium arcticum]